MKNPGRLFVAMLCLLTSTAHASFHLWRMTELYSNADGSVQFLELGVDSDGEQFLTNHALVNTVGGATSTFTFPNDLGAGTGGKRMLIATPGFAALNLVEPDYLVPSGFFSAAGGSVNFADVDTWVYPAMPGGDLSLSRNGPNATNSPQNFAGQTGTIHVVVQNATGAPLNTIGSRGTVTAAAPMYGGFTLVDAATVMIAVRGPSLQTLGATQNPLDAPGLRIFDGAGADLLFNSTGAPGIAACPASNTTAAYYAGVRGQPLDARDTCSSSTSLPAGVYTFTINPTSTDTNGEVLFEVTFNSPSTTGASLRTIGSRGTVNATSPMYGGFTLSRPTSVAIAVRGTSLQTLGITQNPLNEPLLRIFDAAAADLLFASNAAPGIHECLSASATAVYYASVRGQPLDAHDACSPSVDLPAGVYTFTIGPGSSDLAGEVLFEVTFNP
jgi:hypothetical protein